MKSFPNVSTPVPLWIRACYYTKQYLRAVYSILNSTAHRPIVSLIYHDAILSMEFGGGGHPLYKCGYNVAIKGVLFSEYVCNGVCFITNNLEMCSKDMSRKGLVPVWKRFMHVWKGVYACLERGLCMSGKGFMHV